VPRLIALLGTLLAAGLLAAPAHARPAPIGQDPWHPGQTYRGDFPDPAVLRVGSTYYAYATGTAGLNLPVLVSTDLRTWKAAPARRGAVVVDAMGAPARWAQARQVDARRVGVNWAPSVARIHGRYLLAYATRTRWKPRRMCISVATSASPRGPFVDRSAAPLVCPKRGAIDPQLYVERGKPWLLWKTEDIKIHRPTRLWIRRLGPWGMQFSTKSKTRLLLTATMAWERKTVENPAMVLYRGHRYLFYSGNGWARPGYAIGYAICPALTGPCRRVVPADAAVVAGVPQSVPLLASGNGITGPGGGSPFVTPTGRLMLAYHAWDGTVTHYPTSTACLQTAQGCAQRRLHVATLAVDPRGLLSVADPGTGVVPAPSG
jgi:beta-xylosidase